MPNSLLVGATSVVLGLVSLVAGCAGPPVLERQVLGYDEVTSRLDQQLLLLNVARAADGRPVHFTSTTSIAATFDWTTTLGATGRLNRVSSGNFLGLDLGASASENPTFSIVPLSGQAFTERVLTPFHDTSFEFLVFQGGAIDQVLRLLSGGIEVQDADSRFVRFIENDPRRPREYTEFRRIAMHLRALNDQRKLFVRSLVFEEALASDFHGPVSAEDFGDAFKAGLTWRRGQGGTYTLSRLTAGRVVVTNIDPMSLSDEQRFDLNERIKRNPRGFVYLDIRPDAAGGPFAIRGAIKLRSLIQVLAFLARGVQLAPEFDVAPDPRSGTVAENPRATLEIRISDGAASASATNLSVEYDGRIYGLGNTRWDREVFAMLAALFQISVGEAKDVGIPITIAK